MNKEQIAKLKEVALKAPKNPGEWPFYLRSFQAAASPAVILELIALAEHSLSAQDEVLTDEQIIFDRRWSLAQDGFGLERNDETGEYVAYDDAVAALHAALAAAPSPAVAVEPVAQEFASYIIKNHPKWYKDWACKRCALESEILKDGFSCTLHKAHDALGDAKCKACEGMGHIAIDDGFPGDAMAYRAPEPPTMERCPDCDGKGYFPAAPSPSLAVREKLNADCSGDPKSCPDNEGYGCACDPMNKAATEGKPA